jgi:hypothetical protein
MVDVQYTVVLDLCPLWWFTVLGLETDSGQLVEVKDRQTEGFLTTLGIAKRRKFPLSP